MKRLCVRIALMVLFLPAAILSAQNAAVNGLCIQGGVNSLISGSKSSNYMDGIIPSCYVTVYLTGTTTKATIYSSVTGAPLANPFQANALGAAAPGQWLLFATEGVGLDITMAGGIYGPTCTTQPLCYAQPVTLTDVIPGGGGGGGGGGVCGSGTPYYLAIWSNATPPCVAPSPIYTDPSGVAQLTVPFTTDINLITPAVNVIGTSGVAGSVSLKQGTAVTPPTNSVNLEAPASVPIAYTINAPEAQGQGCWYNDGAGNSSWQNPCGGVAEQVGPSVPPPLPSGQYVIVSPNSVSSVCQVHGVSYQVTYGVNGAPGYAYIDTGEGGSLADSNCVVTFTGLSLPSGVSAENVTAIYQVSQGVLSQTSPVTNSCYANFSTNAITYTSIGTSVSGFTSCSVTLGTNGNPGIGTMWTDFYIYYTGTPVPSNAPNLNVQFPLVWDGSQDILSIWPGASFPALFSDSYTVAGLTTLLNTGLVATGDVVPVNDSTTGCSVGGGTGTAAQILCQYVGGFTGWTQWGGSGVTWPTSADLVISNSTNSPAGLAPVNGDCVVGAGGAWTAGACGSSGGISGASAGEPVTATSATAGTSYPGTWVTCGLTGSDLGARIIIALNDMYTALSGYRGTIDASCELGSGQAISENILTSVTHTFPATGSAPVKIILPSVGITVTATQTWGASDVQWLQDGETGQGSLNCGSNLSSTGGIFAFGTSAGIYRTKIHVRMNANSQCTGTMMSSIGAQEGTDVSGTAIVASDSATTTTPIVLFTDALNFDSQGLNVSCSGDNYAVEFLYNSSDGNTTQGVNWRNGTYNNTGCTNTGIAGIYVAPVTGTMSTIQFFNPHMENTGYGIELGTNTAASIHSIFTTGSGITDAIHLDSGGSANGIFADNIGCSSCTNLVHDLRNSVTLAASSYSFGGQAQVAQYPLPSSFTAGGDLSGSSTSQEVTGLLTHALPSLATGYLNWTGSAWALSSVSGGSPGGSNTQLQYNNSSAFGGMSGVTWNNSTDQLVDSQTDPTTFLTNAVGYAQFLVNDNAVGSTWQALWRASEGTNSVFGLVGEAAQTNTNSGYLSGILGVAPQSTSSTTIAVGVTGFAPLLGSNLTGAGGVFRAVTNSSSGSPGDTIYGVEGEVNSNNTGGFDQITAFHASGSVASQPSRAWGYDCEPLTGTSVFWTGCLVVEDGATGTSNPGILLGQAASGTTANTTSQYLQFKYVNSGGTPSSGTFGVNSSGQLASSLPINVPSCTGCSAYVATGTTALATSAIASGACQAVTAGSVNSSAATGATTSDALIWTPAVSLQTVTGYEVSTSGALSIDAYLTSGYVNFNVCNWTGGSVTPGSLTLNWRVMP